MVVAARATPLPTTNTTAIVVSSTIALLFNFITRSLSLRVRRLSLCETSLRFCVLSSLEKKCGLGREAAHLPDGTSLVVHLAHLWCMPGGQRTGAPEARRPSQNSVWAKFGERPL